VRVVRVCTAFARGCRHTRLASLLLSARVPSFQKALSIMRTPTRFITTTLVATAIVPCLATDSIDARPAPIAPRSIVRDAYAATPLRFEPLGDHGAIDAHFLARGAGYVVSVDGDGATLLMNGATDRQRVSIAFRLMGASPLATGRGRHMLPGVTNYLIGNDPRQWRTGLRSFAEVEYRDVYPGVDLVYYGNQRRLEYDFIIAPGADYRVIGLTFRGSTRVSLDAHGNLVLATDAGNLMQHAPTIYQVDTGTRRPVRGGYVIERDGRVGFHIENYDPHLPLIIDPVLSYSSYLGGGNEERAGGVAVDASGNMYVAGLTGAANFPITAPPALTHGRNNWDAFVVKLTANGGQLEYATYLGGSDYDEPGSLAVDAAGHAYVVGVTHSFDFPTLNALQSSRRGFDDSFVTKLDANGAIAYSTYLGGSNTETGSGVAIDAGGRAYVTGLTTSADFPTANAAQRSLSGSPAFRTTDGSATWAGISHGLNTSHVTMFAIDPVDPAIVYAGTDADGVFVSADAGSTWSPTSPGLPPGRVNGMAVDAGGAVYIASNAGVFRSVDRGASWIDLHFLAGAWTIAVDSSGAVYVALTFNGFYPDLGLFKSTDGGMTWDFTGLPIGVWSLAVSQSVIYAGTDQGLFKSFDGLNWTPLAIDVQPVPVTALSVDPHNPDLVYAGTSRGLFVSTSGGAISSPVEIFAGAFVLNVAIAPSDPNIVYAATSFGSGLSEDGGATWRQALEGIDLPFFAIDPLSSTRVYAAGGVGMDVFISRISSDGSTLEYSTFLGGTGPEWDSDIAVDGSGAAYVTGTTQLGGFPVRNAYQPNPGDLMDVFVAKLSATGTVAYATYLGGFGSDYSSRIAVDSIGQAHIVGLTLSPNFPVANAYQPVHGGGFSDVFVTTLNQSGNGLVFSTFLGGNGQDDGTPNFGPDVALGPSGETFVAGTTRSTNFPGREAIQTTYGGGASDAFVSAFDAAGQLQSSTYLGGSGQDLGRRVAFDPTGALVVAGATNSTNFPTRDPLQAQNAGDVDVFIARITVDTLPPADTIAPTTTIGASGTAGSGGWFRSNVTVTLNAADNHGGSGVSYVEYSLNNGPFQRYSAPFSIEAQGATVVRARATDEAGNTENPDVSTVVAIDSVQPVISISSPRSVDYLHSAVLQLSFGATDATSGIDGSPTARLDGASVTSGAMVQLLAMTLGSHTLEVISSDRAGNTSTTTVTFRVIATIDSLIAAVNTFAAQGSIASNTALSLISKLEDAKRALDRGNVTAARGKLDEFRDQVSAQQGKSIATGAAQVLLDDTAFVRAAF
jgi:FIMAH domain-containing protein/beta-propeller repeat-containing protein